MAICREDRRLLRFNSILVQLEVAFAVQRCAEGKFQFHIGAIRSLIKVAGVCTAQGFNSILVQLEACKQPQQLAFLPRFNSILVQLEAGTPFHFKQWGEVSIPYWCN